MITSTTTDRNDDALICVSVGIIAWNEEEAIQAALQSLCQQTLFEQLHQRGLRAEIICMANGCTDRTTELATRFFEERATDPLLAETICWRVVEVPERGKNNSWNLFAHCYSATNAACLCFMDADIVIHGAETLWRMYCALEQTPNASVAVDQPLKDIALNGHRSFSERISLATSGMTRTALAQLSGQLYFIRTPIARRIHLPKDLAACEDGFIKALVCTDFLTNRLCPDRVTLVDGAAHVFQSYRTFRDVLRNQKRQMIGQTIVHILIDQYLKALPMSERLNMAAAIQARENSDRDWLKRLIARHLSSVKYFWRLFPNLLRFRYERWRALPLAKRITHLPSALAGYAVTLLASRMAFSFLKQGSINYWPDTRSPGLKQFVPSRAATSSSERLLSTTVQP
jgi:glycosyltransferase involved in cell wall biosynthesis